MDSEWVAKNSQPRDNSKIEGMREAALADVDIQAQKIILEILEPLIIKYELGVLAEEGQHNNSRLEKHAFFAIDPLDGTLHFVEGKSGFATSIALVLKSGQSLLGAVYDPVHDNLYQATRGRGFFVNGERMEPSPQSSHKERLTLFADRSLQKHFLFDVLQKNCDVQFVGGAVMNVVQVIMNASSCYCKPPKKSLGGCAIWDLAAVSMFLEEMQGNTLFFDGTPLHLNRDQSIYFNDVGLVFTCLGVSYEQCMELFQQ